MVCQNINHIFPQQDWRVQEQAAEGERSSLESSSLTDVNASESIGEVFPRVHRRARYQQGGEIHPVAVHAGKQSEVERVPAVSSKLSYVVLNADSLVV